MFLTYGNLLLLYPVLNIFDIYINTFVQCQIRFFFYIWMEASRCAYKRNIILNSVRQHNHFITQGNYEATCFDYRLVIFRPIFLIESQDAMHTLGSHHVYIHGIHQIRSFVSKGVTCTLFNIILCFFIVS